MELSEGEAEIMELIRERATGDIIRIDVDEHGFLVVQTTSELPDPHLYKVTLEEHPDGSESLKWKLLEPMNQSAQDVQDNQG